MKPNTIAIWSAMAAFVGMSVAIFWVADAVSHSYRHTVHSRFEEVAMAFTYPFGIMPFNSALWGWAANFLLYGYLTRFILMRWFSRRSTVPPS